MALIKATPEKVITLAQSQEGYLEKASNSQLDDFKANAGSGNFTKYARDLDAIPNFYNGKKNGFPWCDVFVDWLFVTAFGVENAKKLLCQPDKSLGAGCGYSAQYYKAKGRFYTENPEPGDQIFFGSQGGDHTGLVCAVDNLYVYTSEGNTSPQAGVVGNGGGVWNKKYALNDNRIYGYGRPDYASVSYEETEEKKPETATTKKGDFTMEMRVLKNGCKGDDVKALQILLKGNGWNGGSWGADGNFGKQTEDAVKTYQKRNGLQVDGMAGKETMSCILGVK